MFVRLTRFPIKPGADEQLEQLGEKYGKIMHDLPGHQCTVTFLEDGALVSFSTWDTEEHAQAVTQASRDKLVQEAADLFAGPPTTTITTSYIHDLRHLDRPEPGPLRAG